MDDQRVGALFRAVRRRRGLRQIDVALAAGVSQSLVSLLERGHLERLRFSTMRRIPKALDIGLIVLPRWRGGEAALLLDEGHARLVELLVRALRAEGWEVLVEYSFNHFGERGSVDVVGWRADRRALVLAEVKLDLLDIQDLAGAFGRKVRIVPGLLGQERGWRPDHVGRLVVLGDTSRNRARVARHGDTFAAILPQRSREARRWLRSPVGNLGAIWFLPDMNQVRAMQRRGGTKRVRGRTKTPPGAPSE